MTNAKKFLALPIVGAVLLFGLAGSIGAQSPDIEGGLNEVGSAAGIETSTSLESTIGQIINVIFAFLGIIFLILIIYAGFLWMTAGGNPDQVGKAKKILIQSVIGLVILFSAFAISSFVITNLGTATGATA